MVASRGRLHCAAELACLLAIRGERWVGLAAYRLAGDECQLVLLEAFERGRGVGNALLAATADVARLAGCRRLWLVTTNDNLHAQRFYERRGLRLVHVWTDAVTESRRSLKPEIPLIGDNGIPIRDELEFELILPISE